MRSALRKAPLASIVAVFTVLHLTLLSSGTAHARLRCTDTRRGSSGRLIDLCTQWMKGGYRYAVWNIILGRWVAMSPSLCRYCARHPTYE